jgi:ribulose 1,5-bisphosphate synthetase/thiazole synthase
LAIGAGALRPIEEIFADEGGGKSGELIAKHTGADHPAATLTGGKVIQPQRELPLLHQTDVLVVGGGPAGVSAAIAAKRAGAEVTLVERYGYFGGQWTGGLVLVVMAVNGKKGNQVTRGIGEEMLQRLDKLDKAVISRRPGSLPTVDAEALKYVMVEMIRDAGVKVFLHCCGVDAVMEGDNVRGAVFESKSGRQAILAKMVVDATGDGDVFAAAGAEFEHLKYRIGLVCRIGGLDRMDPRKAKEDKYARQASATPIPGVRWVNMSGPTADALSVADLTKLEMDHRRQIWKSVQDLRKVPGCENAYLLETAPQLGVRVSRILAGTKTLMHADAKAEKALPDVIGVGGMCYDLKTEWQIPYGALVPVKVDNILAAGRCICAERKIIEHMRLIAPCFVTGHAAGVAAALAVKDRCRPRDVAVPKLQKLLKEQGAYLG